MKIECVDFILNKRKSMLLMISGKVDQRAEKLEEREMTNGIYLYCCRTRN